MQWVHSTQKRRFGPAGLLSALRAALLPIPTLLRPWRGEREGILKPCTPRVGMYSNSDLRPNGVYYFNACICTQALSDGCMIPIYK